MGDFEGVVTLGVAKASKPIFPIRGGEVFERGWVADMSMTPAQKVGLVSIVAA